jgi:mono/diheme cytochrome c family protein
MRATHVVLGLLLVACVALCQAQNDQKHTAKSLPVFDRVAADWRVKEDPYDSDPDAIRAGKKLFRRHCAECHGEDARGLDKAANLRSPAIQDASPGELAWILKNGNLKAGMPSWSGLPEQRRWQIIAYLKSLH